MSKELIHLILTPTTYDTVEFYQVFNRKVMDCYDFRRGKNTLSEIIFACCLPHNIVITMEGDGTLDNLMVSSERDHVHQMERSELQDKDVADARDKLCLYLARNFLDLSMNSVYKFFLAF
nr:hypothetical protein [Tanacetum cinerariifolium]